MVWRSDPRDRRGAFRPAVIGTIALAMMLTATATHAADGLDRTCRVWNSQIERTYPGLQLAVDAARPGDLLTFRGTCRGSTIIRGDVVAVGIETGRTGVPTLSGNGNVRVLAIARGARVKLRDLRVIRGGALKGAGILNLGRLTLTDVRVGRNEVEPLGIGGGIFNRGIAKINGASRISHNRGDAGAGGVWNEGRFVLSGSSLVARNGGVYGNGVDNEGTFVMNGQSAINANWSTDEVGGVYDSGTFTMNDASTIRGNDGGVAWGGPGGVENDGTFTMNDTSTIRDNEGGVDGGPGGVYLSRGSFTMNDIASIDGNRAYCVGGGLYVDGGTLTMNDDTSVHSNAAMGGDCVTVAGGGVYRAGGQLDDVSCGPDGRVHGNEPEDCAADRAAVTVPG